MDTDITSLTTKNGVAILGTLKSLQRCGYYPEKGFAILKNKAGLAEYELTEKEMDAAENAIRKCGWI
jgi:hypothetical protein